MDLNKYNKVQQECIKEIDNNLQIIACAGSGKTRTVVARNLNILINNKATPNEIINITFTKKAANELKQRIYSNFESELGKTEGLAEMYIGTIHSFCLNTLQKTSYEYKKYSILEDVQRTLFAKRFINDSTVKQVIYTDTKGKTSTPFEKYNSQHLRLLLSSCDFIREELLDIQYSNANIINFYNEYIDLLKENYYFDYAQVQYEFLLELTSNIELQQYIKSIKYITIDEYQDTNTIQEKILEKMYRINPNLNICVVGDDDQTIYAWRGSNLNNFKNFDKRYKNVVKKTLSINYRSSEGIVQLGKNIVEHNDNSHINKPFDTNNTFAYEPGDIIVQSDFDSIDLENESIINSILKLKDSEVTLKDGTIKTINYDDMVILVHSTNKLKEFNQNLLNLLEKNNIPFIVDGTKQLFEQDEIRLLFDIFLYYAKEYLGYEGKVNFYDITHLQTINASSLKDFFEKFYNETKDKKYYEITIQDFYLKILKELDYFVNSTDKQMYNLAVFSDIINDFETINFSYEFDSRFKLLITFLYYDASSIYPEGWLSPKFEDVKCLKIMTIHSSKGLEFPVVFMPHLCKDYLFPTKSAGGFSLSGLFRNTLPIGLKIFEGRYKGSNEDLTRLFYVAITRSMKYLILTKSKRYLKPGAKRENSKSPTQLGYALSSPYINLSIDSLLNRQFNYNKTSLNEKNKLIFDFSTLKDIFECPRKFQYSSIFGFRSPLNIRMGYGKSLHNMMDDLHSTYIKEHIIKPTFTIVKNHLHLPLAPKTGKLYSDMFKNSTNILTDYIKKNKSLLDYVSYVEKPIDYKLNDLIFINGRVDLITNTKSKDISIIDFKSDSTTLSPNLRKKQLLIYALGYYKLTGKYPTAVISYDLKTNDSHPQSITPTDVNSIEGEIKSVYNMIKRNVFPKCNNRKSCDNCQFNDLCK